MAGHAQLKFVMTECSKTQIRLTRSNYFSKLYYEIELAIMNVIQSIEIQVMPCS